MARAGSFIRAFRWYKTTGIRGFRPKRPPRANALEKEKSHFVIPRSLRRGIYELSLSVSALRDRFSS